MVLTIRQALLDIFFDIVSLLFIKLIDRYIHFICENDRCGEMGCDIVSSLFIKLIERYIHTQK